jgi:alkylation response protein AidB-like acyl-CoA dehydrogenase
MDWEAEVGHRLDHLLEEHPCQETAPDVFRGAQFDLGLTWVHFPEGDGGLGAPRSLQGAVNQRIEDAGGVLTWSVNPIGYGMAAPTLAAFASAEQRRRYLRSIATGEEIWCQLFSEPGAGSDVASLATRAERDGDEWVVNGQKVWTSLAHLARRGVLLARTDPEQPKHNGLSYFVVDMRSPGVEVRPLRQATADAEFNEVYFTDVRVPDSERLGEVGQGWKVAITTLMNERVAIGDRETPRGGGPIAEAMAVWAAVPEATRRDAVARDRLTRLWIEAETLRLTNLRAKSTATSGPPGPEGSIGKLRSAELNKAIFEFCVDVMGAEGMLYPGYEAESFERIRTAEVDPRKRFLRARANTIEGGTSEIMRNILGERVLGLPGEPRVDRDVPWTQVPR